MFLHTSTAQLNPQEQNLKPFFLSFPPIWYQALSLCETFFQEHERTTVATILPLTTFKCNGSRKAWS